MTTTSKEVPNKRDLPWLDPKVKGAERDGNPAFTIAANSHADAVFKPGYALGRGPAGDGYYSFETRQAYKIIQENLQGAKQKQLLLYVKARGKAVGPHSDLADAISMPSIQQLSIVGQSGWATERVSKKKKKWYTGAWMAG